MRNQFLSLAAVAALLTACDCTEDKKSVSGGFDNFPSTSTMTTDEPSAQDVADFQRDVQDTVHFAFDSSLLANDAQQVLVQQAEWLKNHPNDNLSVEGHCDTRGTVEYNLGLAERRAHEAKKFLIANDIDASRIETVSYGKEHPIDAGTTEEAHAKNRRAVSVLRSSNTANRAE